jgi:DNA-binding response OmpR family regulator
MVGMPPERGPDDAPPPTVLLVGLPRPVLLEMARELHESGRRVLAEPSAEQALFTVSSRAIDLVVSDPDLPGLSGVELSHELRQRGGPPLVMLSRRRDAADTACWLDEGVAMVVAGNQPARTIAAHCNAVMRRSLEPTRPLPTRI